MRAWVPIGQFVRGTSVPVSVARWYWSRGRGLRVVYRDGTDLRSAWGTLPAFLRAVRERRESAIEVTVKGGD
jgi:hypothetical protein